MGGWSPASAPFLGLLIPSLSRSLTVDDHGQPSCCFSVLLERFTSLIWEIFTTTRDHSPPPPKQCLLISYSDFGFSHLPPHVHALRWDNVLFIVRVKCSQNGISYPVKITLVIFIHTVIRVWSLRSIDLFHPKFHLDICWPWYYLTSP